MAEISWIKLKTTMFDDEKIRLIQAVPEADAILIIWIRLLVLAGKTNDDGLIYIQRNMPYSEEMLATLFDKNINTVRLALTTLANFQMIDIEQDGAIVISNWEKHQNVDGMERIKEQNRLRKQKQREREKLKIETSHVTSRDSHATDIDKEEDIEIDKDIHNNNNEHPAELIQNLYGKFPSGILQAALADWLKAWPREMVCYAIQTSYDYGKEYNALKPYINRILDNWSTAKIDTVEKAIEANNQFKQRQSKSAKTNAFNKKPKKEDLPDHIANPVIKEEDPDMQAALARRLKEYEENKKKEKVE